MRRSLSCLSLSSVSGLLVLAGVAPATLAQGPFTQTDMIDVSQIPLVGENRADFPMRITNDGQVFGFSSAVLPSGAGNWKTWRFTASGGALDIGLTGPEYLDPVTGATFAYGQYFTGAGRVLGVQSRNNFTGTDVFLFDGVQTRKVGLLPEQFSFVPANYGNYPVAIDESGASIGAISALVDSLIEFPDGRDAFLSVAWYADANGVSRPLGLTGPGFTDPQVGQISSFAYAIAGDYVIGASQKFVGTTFEELGLAGVDAWRWDANANTYTNVGIFAPEYVDESLGFFGGGLPLHVLADGTVAGIQAGVPGRLATGVWVYEDGVTREVGLEGPRYAFPEEFSNSALYGLNAQGVAWGITTTRTNIGLTAPRAAWVASDGVTRRVGPTGPAFTSEDAGESCQPQYFSNSGLIGGFAVMLPENGEASGKVRAWVQDVNNAQSEAVLLGLTDDLHTDEEGNRQFSLLLGINDANFALGVSFQYLPQIISGVENIGYTGWVYDANTATFTVIPAPATSSGRVDCIGLVVTPRGGVVGFYLKNETPEGGDYRPFYWSPRAGFVDLMGDASIGFSAPEILGVPLAVSPDGTRVAIGAKLLTGDPTLLRIRAVDENPSLCDSIDFNNNQVFPEDQDVIDFLNTLSGAACEGCNDIDFNNNQVFPEDQDVIDFFNVLSGGSC